MRIDIPAGVGFIDPDDLDYWDNPRRYCFRHAVLAVISGKRVEAVLADFAHQYCDSCEKANE